MPRFAGKGWWDVEERGVLTNHLYVPISMKGAWQYSRLRQVKVD